MSTRYDSRQLNQVGLSLVRETNELAEQLAKHLDKALAPGRETSLAFTSLQTAVMWANRAVAVVNKGVD